jgi:hypothetical protein
VNIDGVLISCKSKHQRLLIWEVGDELMVRMRGRSLLQDNVVARNDPSIISERLKKKLIRDF